MGRSAASQVAALGLEGDCVANSVDEYVSIAVSLAKDIPKLERISSGLRERFAVSYLMDYQRYSKDVAALYRGMWREWCSKRVELKKCEP